MFGSDRFQVDDEVVYRQKLPGGHSLFVTGVVCNWDLGYALFGLGLVWIEVETVSCSNLQFVPPYKVNHVHGIFSNKLSHAIPDDMVL